VPVKSRSDSDSGPKEKREISKIKKRKARLKHGVCTFHNDLHSRISVVAMLYLVHGPFKIFCSVSYHLLLQHPFSLDLSHLLQCCRASLQSEHMYAHDFWIWSFRSNSHLAQVSLFKVTNTEFSYFFAVFLIFFAIFHIAPFCSGNLKHAIVQSATTGYNP